MHGKNSLVACVFRNQTRSEIEILKASLKINERLSRSLERNGSQLAAETSRIVAARLRDDIAMLEEQLKEQS